jgi:2,3-bisphosphoglycerate-independent phosphoglycerate mutase
VEVFFRHERQHRVLVVVRGEGLDPRVSDTDPQATGVPPLDPRALDPAARRMAEVAGILSAEARRVLAGEKAATGLLLRGFDSQRELPSFAERYGLRPAAVAVYPMYRGIANLLGMDVLGSPADLTDELDLLRKNWEHADFFFLHHKDADSAGEDGDRTRKVTAIEKLDEAIPDVLALAPDVVVVTGDHATPSQMAAHSWHPVPVVLWSRRCGRDEVERFGERWCLQGGLGRRRSMDLMPIILANASRLAKYGA